MSMSALKGAIEDRLEFCITPALMNKHSTGTLPRLTARLIFAISDKYEFQYISASRTLVRSDLHLVRKTGSD